MACGSAVDGRGSATVGQRPKWIGCCNIGECNETSLQKFSCGQTKPLESRSLPNKFTPNID